MSATRRWTGVLLGFAAVPAALLLAGCSSGSPPVVSGGVLGLSTSADVPAASPAAVTPPSAAATPAPTTAATAPPTARAVAKRASTPAPTPRPVVIVTRPDGAVITLRLGSVLDLRFAGSPDDPYGTPQDSNAAVLAPRSISTAGGNLDASYVAARVGTATLSVSRVSRCAVSTPGIPTPGIRSGICAAVAFPLTVDVVR